MICYEPNCHQLKVLPTYTENSHIYRKNTQNYNETSNAVV